MTLATTNGQTIAERFWFAQSFFFSVARSQLVKLLLNWNSNKLWSHSYNELLSPFAELLRCRYNIFNSTFCKSVQIFLDFSFQKIVWSFKILNKARNSESLQNLCTVFWKKANCIHIPLISFYIIFRFISKMQWMQFVFVWCSAQAKLQA